MTFINKYIIVATVRTICENLLIIDKLVHFYFISEHVQPKVLLNFISQPNSRVPLNTMINDPLKVWPKAIVPYKLPAKLGKFECMKTTTLYT